MESRGPARERGSASDAGHKAGWRLRSVWANPNSYEAKDLPVSGIVKSLNLLQEISPFPLESRGSSPQSSSRCCGARWLSEDQGDYGVGAWAGEPLPALFASPWWRKVLATDQEATEKGSSSLG